MTKTKGVAPAKNTSDLAQEPAEVVESVSEAATMEASVEEERVYESDAAESMALPPGNMIIESVKHGASAAQEAAAQFVPAVGENIRKVAYKGIYYVSYGITFGALMAAKIVPSDSLVAHAIEDGAAAAKAAFNEQKQAAVDTDTSLSAAVA